MLERRLSETFTGLTVYAEGHTHIATDVDIPAQVGRTLCGVRPDLLYRVRVALNEQPSHICAACRQRAASNAGRGVRDAWAE